MKGQTKCTVVEETLINNLKNKTEYLALWFTVDLPKGPTNSRLTFTHRVWLGSMQSREIDLSLGIWGVYCSMNGGAVKDGGLISLISS